MCAAAILVCEDKRGVGSDAKVGPGVTDITEMYEEEREGVTVGSATAAANAELAAIVFNFQVSNDTPAIGWRVIVYNCV